MRGRDDEFKRIAIGEGGEDGEVGGPESEI